MPVSPRHGGMTMGELPTEPRPVGASAESGPPRSCEHVGVHTSDGPGSARQRRSAPGRRAEPCCLNQGEGSACNSHHTNRHGALARRGPGPSRYLQ